jgi:hypothetical protein
VRNGLIFKTKKLRHHGIFNICGTICQWQWHSCCPIKALLFATSYTFPAAFADLQFCGIRQCRT